MKKYILYLLLLAVFLTGCGGEEQATTGFAWEVEDGVALLTGIGTVQDVDILIPSQVWLEQTENGWQESSWDAFLRKEESAYPVVVAGDAFYDCDEIVTVTFMEGVSVQNNTMMGQLHGMFACCDNLRGVYNLPDSVTTMLGTFKDCKALEEISNFPEEVTLLYDCFRGCSSLVSVPRLPEGVESMYGTFMDCASLVSAPDIPDSVTSVVNCFQGCSSLVETPRLPEKVEDLTNCFKDCTSLNTVTHLPDSVRDMASCFENCTSLTQVPDIPASAESLLYTFRNCTSLKATPRLPDTLSHLSSTFEGCTALETVTNIPENVGIMTGTFSGCISLKHIPPLPDHYITLSGCFKDCVSLSGSITIHWEYVFAHGLVGVFDNCTNLDAVYVNACPFFTIASFKETHPYEVIYTGTHVEGEICPWCGETFGFVFIDGVPVAYENVSDNDVEWFLSFFENEVPDFIKDEAKSIRLTNSLSDYNGPWDYRKFNGYARGDDAVIKCKANKRAVAYTIFHELGHCYDYDYHGEGLTSQYGGYKSSQSDEWIQIHDQEESAASYWYNQHIFWSISEEERRMETFAISVGKYFTDPNALKARCPGMYAYMDNLFREALEAENAQ